jgi:BirA family biotin operon repressor/biotin-[acetyl-CoA-carboxylase] ligase
MHRPDDRCQLPTALREVFAEFSEFEIIDSTNAEALRQIAAGHTGTRVFLARAQSAGRGRRGREWVSPRDAGIYLSVARPFALSPQALQGLSLVTALSVRQALSQCGASGIHVKWPNDLLVANRKLAGILLELKQGAGQNHVVFGIGINLALPPASVAEISQPVTDLQTLMAGAVDRSAIVSALLTELLGHLERFEQDGFQPFREQWNRHDRYCNEDIVLQEGEQKHLGKSLGVNDFGALLLQTADGIVTINGGEIFPSLRPAAPEKFA